MKYIPKVFRTLTDEDYLNSAIETANWLKTLEIKTEHGKIWKNFPDGQNGFGRDIMLFGPTNIYSGSAGIGIFFLRLYEATKDEKYLEEAKVAANHIISIETSAKWYEDTLNSDIGGVIPVPGWAIGYSNGPMGQALFLDDIYQVTGEEKYKNYVIKVADDLLEAGKYTEEGLHWSNEEDVVADGGFVFFLVQVYEHFGDVKYLDAARKAADYIAKDALPAKNGGKYWKLLDLSLIGFEKETTFPGFSHGTAGTAWMFAIIYKATKDERYLELAREGAKYLEGIAVGDEEAALIPYQDHPVTGPTNDKFYLGTCHGPAGHTLLFRILYEITGEEEYKDWMIRISRGTIRAGAPERFSWGFWNAQCQCCGTAGILEHFVHMYEFTGEKEFLDYARRTARVLISDSSVSDEEPDKRKWYGAWTRTIPDKVVSYAGLYVGSAGCASALLSLYAVDKDIKLTQLFEYAHFDS
ncbi:MAG: hypothetical protein PUA71_06810 [Eubacteriales bacterium]|nr:hypothetical protein [Eubacteriales bacterium]